MWSMYYLERFDGLDKVIAKISWLKISVFGAISVLVAWLPYKITENFRVK